MKAKSNHQWMDAFVINVSNVLKSILTTSKKSLSQKKQTQTTDFRQRVLLSNARQTLGL